MNLVISEIRLPRSSVEVLDTGPEGSFQYEVWWRPRSNRRRPFLCSARADRALALNDMRWVAEGLDPHVA